MNSYSDKVFFLKSEPGLKEGGMRIFTGLVSSLQMDILKNKGKEGEILRTAKIFKNKIRADQQRGTCECNVKPRPAQHIL
jgi:hypothetical protein